VEVGLAGEAAEVQHAVGARHRRRDRRLVAQVGDRRLLDGVLRRDWREVDQAQPRDARGEARAQARRDAPAGAREDPRLVGERAQAQYSWRL